MKTELAYLKKEMQDSNENITEMDAIKMNKMKTHE
jgi:hypothetical protein